MYSFTPVICPICKHPTPSYQFQFHLQQCYQKAQQLAYRRHLYAQWVASQQQSMKFVTQVKPYVATAQNQHFTTQNNQHFAQQNQRVTPPQPQQNQRASPTPPQQTQRVTPPQTQHIASPSPQQPHFAQQNQRASHPPQQHQQKTPPKFVTPIKPQPKKEDISSPPSTSLSLIPKVPRSQTSYVPMWSSDDFSSYVSGKNIVIVGPSDCNFSFRLGSWIDTQDIVVRLNKSLPIPPSHYDRLGSKTHILYNNLNTTDYPGQNRLDALFLEQHRLAGIVSPYPSIEPFFKDIRKYSSQGSKQIPLRVMDVDTYRKVYAMCDSRPYTGVMAIIDMLRYPIQSLFVTGMDFYHSGYYRGYREIDENQKRHLRKNEIHDAEKQEHMLRWIYLRDHRFHVDGVLKSILLQPWIHWMKQAKKKAATILKIPQLHTQFQCIFEHQSLEQMKYYVQICNEKRKGSVDQYLWIPYSLAQQKKKIGLTPEQHVVNFEHAFRTLLPHSKIWWIPISSAHQWYFYHIFITSVKKDWPDGMVYYVYIGNSTHKEFQQMMDLRDAQCERFITIPSVDRFVQRECGMMSEYDTATLWLLLLFLWNIPETQSIPVPSPFAEQWDTNDCFQHFMRTLCKLGILSSIS